MKLRNILSAFGAAAVLFGLSACADTDAKYEVTPMAAPEFVSATPDADTWLIGDNTISVQFNENIGFATKNTSQILFDGEPVSKALVLGASNTLTVYVSSDLKDTHTLHIPAGLVVTADKQAYNQDIDLTWTCPTVPDNDAAKMTKQLGWGWNLGNHFETSDMTWGYWDGATPTQSVYTALAAAGAKTVRIPVTWTAHMTDGANIDPDFLDEIAQNVDWAIGAGLNVIVNTHHDTFETELGNAANDPSVRESCERLISTIWAQVAAKLGSRSDKLIFETFNEIHEEYTTEEGEHVENWGTCNASMQEVLKEWNQVAVDAIRANEGATKHWIGIPGFAANIANTIAYPVMPDDSANKLMVAVHCYDPYNFCLSTGQTWGHTTTGGSMTDEKAVIDVFQTLYNNYISQNIPVYMGEYGCSEHEAASSNLCRKYYLNFFCRLAHKFGIPMLLWDNMNLEPGTESHGFINHNNGEYVRDGKTLIPMMIEAATSDDSSYDMQSIWNSAPQFHE